MRFIIKILIREIFKSKRENNFIVGRKIRIHIAHVWGNGQNQPKLNVECLFIPKEWYHAYMNLNQSKIQIKT